MSSFWFYKGTTMGLIPLSSKDLKKQALNMILLGIKHGIPREQQIKEYREQVEYMESVIFKCGGDSDKFEKNGRKY